METEQRTTSREEGLFPIQSRWFKLGFFLFLFAWLTYMLSEALGWEGFEDYLFVFILAPIIYGLLLYRSVLLLVPERVGRLTERLDFLQVDGDSSDGMQTAATPESHGRESQAEEEKYAIYMLLWIIALPIAIFLFGMAWVLPVYIFGFVWFFTGSPRKGGLVTVFAVVFMYILFIEILNVLLWTGYLGLPNPLTYLP